MSGWVPTVGMVVAERYRLVAPLDEGGMGTVWRAEHQSLRSPLAVKLLNLSIANHPEVLERFLREAQSAAALRSTHVVQVFDYGVHDGMPFIAMELLNGQSLGARLSQVGLLHPRELAWIFTHISRAISKAHETGITHRDLKPDNIFLVRDGEVELAKVLDFGIAKVADTTSVLSQSSGNTQTGTVLGTPYYMSPEQARGNRAVDHRADVWAMGVIAFECLTGQLPFLSTALGDLVIRICTQPTPRPSALATVPPGFDQWFARACHKDPDYRFQSVKDLNDALQAVLTEPATPSVDLTAEHLKKAHAALPEDWGAFPSFGQGSTPPLPGSLAPNPYSIPAVPRGQSSKKGVSAGAVITGLLATCVAASFIGGVTWVALNIPKDGQVPKLPWQQAEREASTRASLSTSAAASALESIDEPSHSAASSSSTRANETGAPGVKGKRARSALGAGSGKEKVGALPSTSAARVPKDPRAPARAEPLSPQPEPPKPQAEPPKPQPAVPPKPQTEPQKGVFDERE